MPYNKAPVTMTHKSDKAKARSNLKGKYFHIFIGYLKTNVEDCLNRYSYITKIILKVDGDVTAVIVFCNYSL